MRISHWVMEKQKTWIGISAEVMDKTEGIVNEGGDAKWSALYPYQPMAVKNAYPLPLISTLIDKLKGAKFFSKMDV